MGKSQIQKLSCGKLHGKQVVYRGNWALLDVYMHQKSWSVVAITKLQSCKRPRARYRNIWVPSQPIGIH